MCEHLVAVERYLAESGHVETYRGQPWSKNCREWVYFDCVLDVESLRSQFELDACVEIHENTDPKSGMEKGLYCSVCHDAVMGRAI